MEIDITNFVYGTDTWEFSGSQMTHGPDAGRQTWKAAKAQAADSPLLTTEEELEALRDHMRGYGAWDAEEIAAWSVDDCNALFIQLISGDMRESGMDDCVMDGSDSEALFDWEAYHEDSSEGRISGRIYRGDIEGSKSFGRIFYYFGE
jgi:hypothetical protein